MNYYIDTEFIEGFHKPFLGRKRHYIDLISIGIICEDGREYYAVSKDFDLKKVWNTWQQRTGCRDGNNLFPKHYWLRENVLYPIFKQFYPDNLGNLHHYPDFNYNNMKNVINNLGKSNKTIATEIYQFICPIEKANKYADIGSIDFGAKTYLATNPPKFYGYYSDYDWVLFCSLFGKRIDLPECFPYYCIDLKQTLDEKELSLTENGKVIHKGDMEASLFNSIKDFPNFPKEPIIEHHALEDARWNKKLHSFIKNL